MAKRKRRTKAEIEASKVEKHEPQGLGDTIEQITEATGIKKAVETVSNWLGIEDCGCDKRKEKLNELFPYKKPLCLNKDEYDWLTYYFETTQNTVKATDQMKALEIYNRVFQQKRKVTSCADCYREVHKQLTIVYKTYEEEN